MSNHSATFLGGSPHSCSVPGRHIEVVAYIEAVMCISRTSKLLFHLTHQKKMEFIQDSTKGLMLSHMICFSKGKTDKRGSSQISMFSHPPQQPPHLLTMLTMSMISKISRLAKCMSHSLNKALLIPARDIDRIQLRVHDQGNLIPPFQYLFMTAIAQTNLPASNLSTENRNLRV